MTRTLLPTVMAALAGIICFAFFYLVGAAFGLALILGVVAGLIGAALIAGVKAASWMRSRRRAVTRT